MANIGQNFSQRVLLFMQIKNIGEDEAKKQVQEEMQQENNQETTSNIECKEDNEGAMQTLDYLSAINAFLVTNKPVEDGDKTIYSFTNSKSQTVTINGKKVKVSTAGTTTKNPLKLTVDKEGKINIENNGATSIKFDTTEDLNINVSKSTKNLSITSGSGNDTITVQEGVLVYKIDGGKGNDIIVNASSVSSIYGGEGNDVVLNSGTVKSTISGGKNDDLIVNTEGAKTKNVSGDTGNDTIAGAGTISASVKSFEKVGENFTGKLNNLYYNNGELANNVLVNGIFYQNGKAATGVFEGKYYINGKPGSATVTTKTDNLKTSSTYKNGVLTQEIVSEYNSTTSFNNITLTSMTTTKYDSEGYITSKSVTLYTNGKKGTTTQDTDAIGYNKDGYNKDGYDKNGYNKQGLDVNNKDREGRLYDKEGKLFKGLSESGVMYQDGVPSNGNVDGVFYTNGIPANGQVGDKHYTNGIETEEQKAEPVIKEEATPCETTLTDDEIQQAIIEQAANELYNEVVLKDVEEINKFIKENKQKMDKNIEEMKNLKSNLQNEINDYTKLYDEAEKTLKDLDNEYNDMYILANSAAYTDEEWLKIEEYRNQLEVLESEYQAQCGICSFYSCAIQERKDLIETIDERVKNLSDGDTYWEKAVNFIEDAFTPKHIVEYALQYATSQFVPKSVSIIRSNAYDIIKLAAKSIWAATPLTDNTVKQAWEEYKLTLSSNLFFRIADNGTNWIGNYIDLFKHKNLSCEYDPDALENFCMTVESSNSSLNDIKDLIAELQTQNLIVNGNNG